MPLRSAVPEGYPASHLTPLPTGARQASAPSTSSLGNLSQSVKTSQSSRCQASSSTESPTTARQSSDPPIIFAVARLTQSNATLRQSSAPARGRARHSTPLSRNARQSSAPPTGLAGCRTPSMEKPRGQINSIAYDCTTIQRSSI